MTDRSLAIQVQGLGKRYRIGLADEMSDSFAHTLANFVRSPLKNYRKYRALYKFDDVTEDDTDVAGVLWALRDLSFEVARGEVVGIIGTNGAGKSTLLKILSRITPPTTGRALIYGRVGSLLEVGTGFHQELSGRENVYLNGTILGMRKKEIDQKFDEIVDFSGVEEFLDTPVKRYSSGMRVRLAFAVAAHLEPEILIIDEVLAVGDAAFQRKCLSKMEDVGHEGRTVLFVSHNMPAVTRLCERAVLLNGGRLIADAPAHEVVSSYLTEGHGASSWRSWEEDPSAPGDATVRLRMVRIVSQDGSNRDALSIRHPVGLQMEYEVLREGRVLQPRFTLWDGEGVRVFTSLDRDPAWRNRPRPPGRYMSTAWIPGDLLNEGLLYVSAAMKSMNPLTRHFHAKQVVAFQVVDDALGGGARADYTGDLGGVVRPMLEWETTHVAPQQVRAVVGGSN